jgi:hypothetical protein
LDEATVKLVENLRKRGYKPRQFLMATATASALARIDPGYAWQKGTGRQVAADNP